MVLWILMPGFCAFLTVNTSKYFLCLEDSCQAPFRVLKANRRRQVSNKVACVITELVYLATGCQYSSAMSDCTSLRQFLSLAIQPCVL